METLVDRLAERARGAVRPAWVYAAQRAYVAAAMPLVAAALEAQSEVDDELRREVAGFPEGLGIGLSVLGDPGARLRLRKQGERLVRAPADARADLDVVFKHPTHAFLVLTFQESTARAFANDRAITAGDTSLGMRLVRCLDRMESVLLPRVVAERAVKGYPDFPVAAKSTLAARTLLALAKGAVR